MNDSPDLVARAAAARAVLERHRDAGERDRCLTDDAIAALTDAGLLRALVPRGFGGGGCSLTTIVDATSEVAEADPAAAWVLMILGSGAWITGLFPARAQQELYADGPDARTCTVLAPRGSARRVDGGWRLTGRWSPASGCRHAQWAMLGFLRGDGRTSLALVPMAELTVEDTWFPLGMRATGSNAVSGTDLVVPDHRVLPLDSGGPEHPAMIPTLATYLIAPFLGIATAVLDHVVDNAGRKGIAFSHHERQRDSTAFQLAVADASLKIDLARLIAANSADIIDGHAGAGTCPDSLTRARIRQHTGHAVQLCRQAVDDLVTAHGASALADSHPLQRFLRDIHTAARHAVANPATCAEIFGRALLGVQPNITEMV